MSTLNGLIIWHDDTFGVDKANTFAVFTVYWQKVKMFSISIVAIYRSQGIMFRSM
jgi:hypothetical protein